MIPNESNVIQCRCGGETVNCMYCRGSGWVVANNYQVVDEIMATTRVVYCTTCGQQNRVQENVLPSIALTCHKCKADLFRPDISPFDQPPFQRKKLS